MEMCHGAELGTSGLLALANPCAREASTRSLLFASAALIAADSAALAAEAVLADPFVGLEFVGAALMTTPDAT